MEECSEAAKESGQTHDVYLTILSNQKRIMDGLMAIATSVQLIIDEEVMVFENCDERSKH